MLYKISADRYGGGTKCKLNLYFSFYNNLLNNPQSRSIAEEKIQLNSVTVSEEKSVLEEKFIPKDIDIYVEGVKKDPLLVTPIGICLNYYDQRNNFIFVNVNGDRVKLYNNNKLSLLIS